MRKSTKIILATATAAALAAGTLAAAACSPQVHSVTMPQSTTVTSNGGFVVGVGEYYYFINGKETYTSDNTYGTPVKGALQRIKKTDAASGTNTVETVIPSLMVAGDAGAGLFVYGDRIYYATPTNTPNLQGEIENSYLDFKSAKLDGSDITHLFRLESNSTPYRFVKGADGKVYVIYASANATTSSNFDLHSRNTEDPAKDVVLAENATGYLFNSSDPTDATVYFTMGVVDRIDTDDPDTSIAYNQIYRVEADTEDTPYPVYHEWDEDWLKDHDDKEPYVNFGTVVADGIGSEQFDNHKTKFTHSKTRPQSSIGYTYSLKSFANDGIYFIRTNTSTTGSTVGASGSLYYLPETKAGTDSIAVNDDGSFETVATAGKTDKADGAYFYIDEKGHHYLYADGSNIVRADVETTSGVTTTATTTIARGASSPEFMFLDNASHSGDDSPVEGRDLHYLYYTGTTSNGVSVNRAVYNGITDLATGQNDYADLPYKDEDNSYFASVRILDAEHATGWYDAEVVDGLLFYANAKTYGSTAYNYISVINLNEDGKLMDNKQIKAFNEKLEEITDGSDGVLATISADASTTLRNAIEYYFYTGDKEFTILYDNIKENEDAGEDDLYEEEDLNALKAFAEGKGFTYNDTKELFKEGDFTDGDKSYRVYSYFVTEIGTHSDADVEAMESYYKNFLNHYEAPVEEEETGLEGWEIALIVIACVLAVGAGAGVGLWFLFKKRKEEKKNAPKPKRMHVDTTDDKSVDVYNTDSDEAGEAEPAEEPAGEVAEEPADESAEEPAPDTDDPYQE